jgi:GR25 family glycosyltransferase involved in LPS biosynthesis
MVMPTIKDFLVINLKDSTARRQHMRTMLMKKNIRPRFVEVEGPKKRFGSPLKLGEVGVWFGHQLAWRAILDDPNKPQFTMIMEDDMLLPGDPRKVDYTEWNVAVPQDAHMIFLHSRIGANPNSDPPFPGRSTVLGHKPIAGPRSCLGVNTVDTYTWGYSMIGYVVTRAGAQLLLDKTTTPGYTFRIPVDGFPFSTTQMPNGLKVYVALDMPVVTREDDNAKSDKDAVTRAMLRRLGVGNAFSVSKRLDGER